MDLSAAALLTFRHNFPEATAVCASVTTRDARDQCRELLKPLAGTQTLIVSGPPCQGFSVAGARVSRDARNRVLSAVARIVAHVKPDAALIENVAALLADRHRSYLARFKSVLRGAGYSVVVLELNASDFGVPQRRRRMICFAAKASISEDIVREELQRHMCIAPTAAEALGGLGSPLVYAGPSGHISPAVANHVAMRHSQSVQAKIAAIEPGAGPLSYRRLHPLRLANTLISGNRAPPAHFSEPRSITVREAARLQGFPDSFEVKGPFASQMLHVTNAVPPALARAAIKALLAAVERSQ